MAGNAEEISKSKKNLASFENIIFESISSENPETGKLNLAHLPSELLLKILSFLPHCDLQNNLLVSRKFRELASDPALWKIFPIPAMEISQHSGLDRLLSVLKLPRFRKLQVLDLNRVHLGMMKRSNNSLVSLNQPPESEYRKLFLEILKVASSLPLTWLDLSYNNLSSLSSPDIVTKLILNIPHVELFATGRGGTVYYNFIYNILENVTETSVLNTINLGSCDLDTLPVTLVTKLNFMSSLALRGAFMTVEQANALMTDMAKDTKIKEIDIGWDPIIDIKTFSDVFENLEPELVATALNNVEHLIYNKVKFTDGDCCDFPPDLHLATFLEVMGRDTKLKQVEIEENNFFHIPPEVVAKAFNNLKHLELKPNPNNTSAQIVAILELMAQKTKLVTLKFNFEDLSWLNPGLVARAVVQVEQVDMLCNLSRAHVRAILGQIDERSKIMRLNLGDNDVTKVPKHILESAVKILKREGGVVLVSQKRKMFLRY